MAKTSRVAQAVPVTTNSRPVAVGALSDSGLVNFIDNHRRRAATDRPVYAEALAERERRTGRGLDFDKSYAAIRAAAAQRRFLSFQELAASSEADWGQVRNTMSKHLLQLMEYAHRRQWPMLSAVVVSHDKTDTGDMKPSQLLAFAEAARGMGYDVGEDKAFLQDQQQRVFAWAETPESGPSDSMVREEGQGASAA